MRNPRLGVPVRLLLASSLCLLALPACSASVGKSTALAQRRPDRISSVPGWAAPSQRPDRLALSSSGHPEFPNRRPDRIQPSVLARPAGPMTPEAPQPQPEPAMMERWTILDMRSLGIASVMQVPQGAEVSASADGVIVRRPPDFAIEVLARPVDFAGKIMAIEHDSLRSLLRFIGDAHDTLVYETTSLEGKGEVEYHFVTQIESEGHFFTCEDVRGRRYTLADVDRMLRACKSMEARENRTLPVPPNPLVGPQTPDPAAVPPPPPGGADLLP